FAWWPWPRSPNPHRACRDACTTTSPALGPGGAATKEEAVNTHSNARFAGEVEGNVSGTAISFKRKPRSPSAVKTRQLFSQQLKDPLTTVIAAPLAGVSPTGRGIALDADTFAECTISLPWRPARNSLPA